MKICFFHLMPYRFLPDDFERKYRSVWVDVPHHLYDAEKTHGLYNEFLDELEFAEAQGFDGLCVNEHHNNAYGLMPSPNLMAAALTGRTSQAAIVVLGNSLAAYNPPLRVAEEFAMLDLLSGGRLVAGFPVGTSMDMNFAYGINPATLRDRYYEAHDLVMQAWTRPEVFAFNGSTRRSATRTSGRSHCRSRIRPCGSPVAAASRRGSGRPSSTTSTATSRTSVTSVARSPWTASGRPSRGSAPTTIRSGRGSCSSCACRRPTRRPSVSTSRTCTTSTRNV